MEFKSPEGATPIEDADGLIPENIFTRDQLNAAEAENILQAVDLHLKRRKNPKRQWLTEAAIRRVHKDMFGKVWRWAGQVRDTTLNIGIHVHLIQEELKKLCDDVWFWDSEKSPLPVLERAARLHHRLAYIHPFKNGNGRHARLMADIYLRSHHHRLPMWPVSDMADKGNTRSDYLAALRKADEGDFSFLVDYIKRYL